MPHVGVAGRGKNTWYTGVIKYARTYTSGDHDWLDSGGHRRLQSDSVTVRPLVPAPLKHLGERDRGCSLPKVAGHP